MTKRMLIDSTDAEETRVVVLDGNRLEDYDVEAATKQQLKGNIYLAKIVRVEPSLQAAFVEFGGNRHGFLAFGEIHPDYYQIPVADRKRLIEAQEAEAREAEEAEDRAAAHAARAAQAGEEAAVPSNVEEVPAGLAEPEEVETKAEQVDPILDETAPDAAPGLDPAERPLALAEEIAVALGQAPAPSDEAASDETPSDESVAVSPAEAMPAETRLTEAALVIEHEQEHVASGPAPAEAEDERQEHRSTTPRFLRNYKIQEVMRRRQILLVQVVKEERGTKGAALTTYISLAGRFSVLMPNSPRGGGISRKITSSSDRRRLKEVMTELDLPRGMGLIVRTAGANRPKPEIMRDCEYLLGQWDQIRELTLKSMAPALIYEEASLIKRAIRDVYSRDVDDILVDGEQGWRAARDFMRMLMPTHARKVQLWKDPQPLFVKAQVEAQLDAMLQPVVQLRSGGYLVINQTEALVAIDVNSGRSTRERGIEETALRTNMEAAEEAARQLRLRDLAGLIVIDFIDMESRRNIGAVEKRLKDALKNDRARIQIGSISHFGLLEMSRQRLRPSLAETSLVTCPHCSGAGQVRSTESAALHVLRGIEEEGGKRRAAEIVVHVAGAVALYILNHKRVRLGEIERRHGMTVCFAADESLLPPMIRIERVRTQVASDLPPPVSQLAPPEPFEDPDEEVEAADEAEEDEAPRAGETAEEGEQHQRKRRRRRRGGRRDEATADEAAEGTPSASELDANPADDAVPSTDAADTDPATPAEPQAAAPADGAEAAPDADAEDGERRSRRGRRGGRRRRREPGEAGEATAEAAEDEAEAPPPAPAPAYAGPTPADPFAGAHAFDIFDAIEQAEQARAVIPIQASAPPETVPAEHVSTASEIAGEPAEPAADDAIATATELAAEPTPMATEAPAEPEVPGVVTEAPVEESVAAESPAEPVPDTLPAPESPAEPSVPLAPPIQPLLIGKAEVPAEKKRGWWSR